MADGRVFFLGAGFSASAGIPLTNKLLPAALRLFEAEGGGLFDRVKDYAAHVGIDFDSAPGAEEFAQFCTYLDFVELRELGGGERWSDEGSRERVALKFFLAKAIALATPSGADIPQHYIDFANDLTEKDIVVTFNWDVLLENALNQAGKKYAYNFEPEAVHILKMHGSVNWSQSPAKSLGTGRPDFDFKEIGFKEGMIATEVECSSRLQDGANWKNAKPLIDQVKPLIVLPGYGKAVDVRLLAGLWYRPEFLNVRSGPVSVIGLSVAQDDYMVSSLFRYLFRGIFDHERLVSVINPAKEACDQFAEIADGEVDLHLNHVNFDEGAVDLALCRGIAASNS